MFKITAEFFIPFPLSRIRSLAPCLSGRLRLTITRLTLPEPGSSAGYFPGHLNVCQDGFSASPSPHHSLPPHPPHLNIEPYHHLPFHISRSKASVRGLQTHLWTLAGTFHQFQFCRFLRKQQNIRHSCIFLFGENITKLFAG